MSQIIYTRTKACNARARFRAPHFVVVLEQVHSVIEYPKTCEHWHRESMGIRHAPKHRHAPGSAPPNWFPTYYYIARTCNLLRKSRLSKNATDLHLCRQLAIKISQCIHLRCMRLPRTNHLKVLMVIRVQHEWGDPQWHRIAHKLIDAIPRFLSPVLKYLIQSSSDSR